MSRYFKLIANKKYISEWKSKGLSNESIKPSTPLIDHLGNKTRLKFNGRCLKQNKLRYTHRTIGKIDIVYEITASGSNTNDPTFKTLCLVELN